MNLVSLTWAFVNNPANDFGGHTHDFLMVALWSIVLSILIGVPLGIIAAQIRIVAILATSLSGAGRAIPTIAFFGLAAALPVLGLYDRSAIIALTLLGIPPILLNTIAGLQGVDSTLVDAARGMGMTFTQRMVRVQLPLVLPVIAAGVRTTTVQVIATTPLITFLGLGGYGEYIVGGLGINTPAGVAQVLAGAIPVVVLAMVAEYGLAAVQRALTPAGLRQQTAPIAESIADSASDDAGKGVVTA